ncbi:YecA family protein [Haloferula sp. A504]|uniref:YecA family protein n=1 Tax=Haloferula sp. A504 TaxID=3373601 RepID=UPI0031C685C5|nr:SEC-C domain-containing protein [Verrucomicrobiaceae bacterium E54]
MREPNEVYEEAMSYRIEYDRVESEMPEGLTQDMIEELHDLAISKRREGVPRLKRLAKRFPGVPVLQNYLAVAYEVRGEKMRSRWVRSEMLKQHPDYFFAKVAEAKRLHEEDRAAEMPTVLGESMTLREALGTEEDPHISEWKNFQLMAAFWHLDAGRVEHAEMILKAMRETEGAGELAKILNQQLMMARWTSMQDRMRRDEERRVVVEGPPEPEYRERTPRPAVDPAVAALYDWADDLPQEVVEVIRRLPRELAVRDLRAVLRDAIDNAAHYFHMDGEYEEAEYWTGLHALFLLGELAGAEGREQLLECLSMNGEVVRWMLIDDFTWQPLVGFLEDGGYADVAAWLRRPGMSEVSRMGMVRALSELAAARPEKRDQAVEVLMDFAGVMAEGEAGDGVLDTRVVAVLLGELVELRVRQAEGLIRRFEERGWVEEMWCGSAAEMIGELGKPESKRRKLEKLPGWYRREELEPPAGGDMDLGMLDPWPQPEPSPPSLYRPEASPQGSGFVPRVVEQPEPGRNDPCPCGSGRKYKKCCMR